MTIDHTLLSYALAVQAVLLSVVTYAILFSWWLGEDDE